MREMVVAGMQSEFCVRETGRGAAGHGFPVRLAAGAHATYDGAGQPAADLAAEVERELAAEGVRVEPAADIRF